MDFLWNFFVVSLSNGLTLSISIIVLIIVALNIKNIANSIRVHNKNHLNKISEALSYDKLSGSTRTFLENEFISEQFRQATEIEVDNHIREAIIQIYKNAKGEISFVDLKRAINFMKIEDSKLIIEIRWYQYLKSVLNLLVGLTSLLIGAGLFLLISLSNNVELYRILITAFWSVVYFSLAAYSLLQVIPLVSSFLIKDKVGT